MPLCNCIERPLVIIDINMGNFVSVFKLPKKDVPDMA